MVRGDSSLHRSPAQPAFRESSNRRSFALHFLTPRGVAVSARIPPLRASFLPCVGHSAQYAESEKTVASRCITMKSSQSSNASN